MAGIINTLRVLGTLCSAAFSGQILFERSSFHHLTLNSGVGHYAGNISSDMSGLLQREAGVMSSSDLYLIFTTLALLLMPLALLMQRIPAPQITKP